MKTKVIRVAKSVLNRIRRKVGKSRYESWTDVLRKLAYLEGHETY